MSTVYLILVCEIGTCTMFTEKTSEKFIYHDNGLDETVYVDTADQIANSGNNNSNKRSSGTHTFSTRHTLVSSFGASKSVVYLFSLIFPGNSYSLFHSHTINCRFLNRSWTCLFMSVWTAFHFYFALVIRFGLWGRGSGFMSWSTPNTNVKFNRSNANEWMSDTETAQLEYYSSRFFTCTHPMRHFYLS